MKRKTRDDKDLEKVLQRIREMTYEEWLEVLNWKPPDATETWRTAVTENASGSLDIG